jgi:hypothetical protein
MSTTFNLTNTASDVNTAIQAVVGADSTPDAASANMVTSQGIFNHVNTELGPFKGKTLTTEAAGIAATNDDTSVPTNAAVSSAIGNAVGVATYSPAATSTAVNYLNNWLTGISVVSDPNNLGSVTESFSGGQDLVSLQGGTYIISVVGEFATSYGSYNTLVWVDTVFTRYPTAADGIYVSPFGVYNVYSTDFLNYGGHSITVAHSSAFSVGVKAGFSGSLRTAIKHRNVVMTIIKLA